MLQEHLKHISFSRLSTYLNHFYFGDKTKLAEAVVLYTAIQHRSGIFFSLIQEIEVATRNAISDCLRTLAPNNDLAAYFHFLANSPNSPLSKKAKGLLKNSITNTQNENDIIANITFGFWVNLLDVKDVSLKKAFRQLFPNAFPNIQTMYLNLKQVYTFRNDLFHQDKAWNRTKVKKPEHILRDYERTYRHFENLLGKIAPARLVLRNKAAINSYYSQLNFDITLFHSELSWLCNHI